MTFALGRRGIERERLGGNYLISRGVPSAINEPIWHPVQDHLKSSAAIWTCPMCQKCNNQHLGTCVTLSPRFKCNTWVFQITLVPQALRNARHGVSQRSGQICQKNKCVHVELRQQCGFQSSILNQQMLFCGRS